MQIIKKCGKILFFFFFSLLTLFVIFILWNSFPPLPYVSSFEVQKMPIDTEYPIPQKLRIGTYNIQYGAGLHLNKKMGKEDSLEHMEELSRVIKRMDVDILILQEVDFYSKRSHLIDQSEYLAVRCGYPYIAKAPHWIRKVMPYWNGLTGPLNHGLCILSRFPLIENQTYVFRHPTEAPFYVRWLYSPHGGQKAVAQVGEEKITVINLHLEPWAQKTREKTVKRSIEWISKVTGPLILGGDLNAIPPEAKVKTTYNLFDTPWFIDKSQWNIQNDQTVLLIRNIPGLNEFIPSKKYAKKERKYFTYPSNDPQQKLDYLFAGGGLKIIEGYVFHKAKTASDHLPVIGIIDLNAHSSADDSSQNTEAN